MRRPLLAIAVSGFIMLGNVCRAESTFDKASADAFAVPPVLSQADVPDPKKLPPQSLRREKVRMAVCPGQVGLGSLCLYAGDKPLKDVTLRISDLLADKDAPETEHDLLLLKLPASWKFRPDTEDKGKAAGWFRPEIDDSQWAQVRTDISKGWDAQGFEKDRVGYGWYRQVLTCSKKAAEAKHRLLFFQAVDEQAWVYLDGKLLFEHTTKSTGLSIDKLWTKPFALDITKVWSGKRSAQLTVRVHNSGGMGGIWMPVHLLVSDAKLPDMEQMKAFVLEEQTRRPDGPQKRINSVCIDPYVVKWWYRTEKRQRRAELLVKDPALVVADDDRKSNTLRYPSKEMRDSATLQPVSLGPRQGVQYYLIARIPASTPPGTYRGLARLVTGDTPIAEVPLEIKVLPFALEESLLEYLIYYRGGKLGTKPSPFAPVDSEYKTREQMASDVADMLDHGIRHMIWYSSVDNILHLRHKFGIKGPVCTIYPSAPGPEDTDYLKWSAAVIEQLRQGGCDPVFIAGPDEPTMSNINKMAKRIEFVNRQLGVDVFTAIATRPYLLDQWQILRNHPFLAIVGVDEEYHKRVGARGTAREMVAKWRRGGKPVYSYGLASLSADAAEFRQQYGLLSWKQGVDGAAPYAYQHSSSDPWDPLTFQCNFTWPTVDGRISTLQWEGMRAAVTDVRFASTLAKWLFKTAGPLRNHPARVAARRALESLDPNADLDAQRQNLITHILTLRRAMMDL